MKTVIVALNSKYIHTSLAAWYLKAACNEACGDVSIYEGTINDSFNSILAEIYRLKPDVAAFSCYIWNIELIMKLIPSVKKILPEAVIVLGGPEVSYDSEGVIEKSREIDYILAGEGETSFRKLIEYLSSSKGDINDIDGLFCGDGNHTAKPFAVEEDLSSLKSPYTEEMLKSAGNRIVYYEASRGCPFSCSYCLSSTTSGVRLFPMERVEKELLFLVNSGIRQVKFVDRTFNCNRERAKDIFKFIISWAQSCPDSSALPNFHFEAAADLFDEEMLDLLSKAPEGLIQFEIGVQTVNEQSLRAVGRKTDTTEVFKNIAKLKKSSNCHIHLDLIAGLPYEGLSSFSNSFNRVYGLEPHMLQLGFLKLLKGTAIRKNAAYFDYKYNEHPPYEILKNKYLSYPELLMLKELEEVLDRYFNSGKFPYSISYLSNWSSEAPFSFYMDFSKYLEGRGFFQRSFIHREYYTLLLDFTKNSMEGIDRKAAIELLRLDFYANNHSSALPEGLKKRDTSIFRDKCFDFLKDEDNISRFLPTFTGQAPKEIWKHVTFEILEVDVKKYISNREIAYTKGIYLFDYSMKNPVNGQYRFVKVEF